MESDGAEDIRRAKLIIIDECTMASNHVLNTIDKLLQEVMQTNVLFGGKVMLIGGDFRQCLAIVPHAMRSAVVQSSLKYSQNWHNFEKLSLVENMRCVDQDYNNWLLQLGAGTLDCGNNLPPDTIEIPENLICDDDLVTETFGKTISSNDIPSLSRKVILCPKNVDVDRINNQMGQQSIGLLHEQSRVI